MKSNNIKPIKTHPAGTAGVTISNGFARGVNFLADNLVEPISNLVSSKYTKRFGKWVTRIANPGADHSGLPNKHNRNDSVTLAQKPNGYNNNMSKNLNQNKKPNVSKKQ